MARGALAGGLVGLGALDLLLEVVGHRGRVQVRSWRVVLRRNCCNGVSKLYVEAVSQRECWWTDCRCLCLSWWPFWEVVVALVCYWRGNGNYLEQKPGEQDSLF